jgi:selenocysteine-specific elongation factor
VGGVEQRAMKHVVVGTAGHVDHGKTSLVEALTGTNCDRLPEEKARGITLELGFAAWNVSPRLGASVVDVPGHEKFVRTMVAGATGIDVVLLCVAADDGVMPQTREHLDVCALLGVRAGVVALTKCDVADAETLALVEEDVRDAVRGTFLEGAEIVRTSARTKVGLDTLSAAVEGAAKAAAPRAADGPAFLAIDRVFSKPGAGTVVTGTLSRGALAVDDAVAVLPTARGGATPARVRGLHVHGVAATRVQAPTRVAVNVKGDGEGEVARGAALASDGWQLPTRMVQVDLHLLASSKGLPRRAAATFHVGTASVPAVVTVLGAPSLAPGEKAAARVSLRVAVATYAGQPFVLRRAERGRDRTVGGGVVTDPHPRATRGKAPGAVATVAALVEEARYAGIAHDELARRLAPGTDVAAAARALIDGRGALEVAGRLYPAALLGEAERAVLACVRALHAERPHAGGVMTAELETRVAARVRPLVPAAVASLVAARTLAQTGAVVRDASRGGFDPVALAKVRDVYARAGLAPPLDEEARAAVQLDVRAFKDALVELKRAGTLRALGGGLHFDAAALDGLEAQISAYFASSATLTPGAFKELAGGLSRKYAIPLLEWLDTQGVSRRQGDARVAGPRARRA